MQRSFNTLQIILSLFGLAFVLITAPGCITFTNYAIPADRIPDAIRLLRKGSDYRSTLLYWANLPLESISWLQATSSVSSSRA